MPNDDAVSCGCEHCSKIKARINKAKEIEELLHKTMTSVYTHGESKTGSQILNLVRVLRIMNGIE